MINKNRKDVDVVATLSDNVYKRITEGSEHQLDYEIVLDHIANTGLHKCEKYGESRYEEKDLQFNAWMCFSDVHRKYIRLRQLNELAVAGDEEAMRLLKDAYLDIANYGIMGFQILDKGNQDEENV